MAWRQMADQAVAPARLIFAIVVGLLWLVWLVLKTTGVLRTAEEAPKHPLGIEN